MPHYCCGDNKSCVGVEFSSEKGFVRRASVRLISDRYHQGRTGDEVVVLSKREQQAGQGQASPQKQRCARRRHPQQHSQATATTTTTAITTNVSNSNNVRVQKQAPPATARTTAPMDVCLTRYYFAVEDSFHANNDTIIAKSSWIERTGQTNLTARVTTLRALLTSRHRTRSSAACACNDPL